MSMKMTDFWEMVKLTGSRTTIVNGFTSVCCPGNPPPPVLSANDALTRLPNLFADQNWRISELQRSFDATVVWYTTKAVCYIRWPSFIADDVLIHMWKVFFENGTASQLVHKLFFILEPKGPLPGSSDCILSQYNPIHILITYSSWIHFNIILISTI